MIPLGHGHYVAAHQIAEIRVEGIETAPQVTIRLAGEHDWIVYKQVRGNDRGTGFAEAESVAGALAARVQLERS